MEDKYRRHIQKNIELRSVALVAPRLRRSIVVATTESYESRY